MAVTVCHAGVIQLAANHDGFGRTLTPHSAEEARLGREGGGEHMRNTNDRIRMRITISQTMKKMIAHCRALANFTEEPGFTTRTFLSHPMHQVHAYLRDWMERAGMAVHVDAVGNLRGRWGGEGTALWIGSHLDTVPRAGAFDGILGVVMAITLVEQAQPPFPVRKVVRFL